MLSIHALSVEIKQDDKYTMSGGQCKWTETIMCLFRDKYNYVKINLV